jgi:hypothetical protein
MTSMLYDGNRITDVLGKIQFILGIYAAYQLPVRIECIPDMNVNAIKEMFQAITGESIKKLGIFLQKRETFCDISCKEIVFYK